MRKVCRHNQKVTTTIQLEERMKMNCDVQEQEENSQSDCCQVTRGT